METSQLLARVIGPYMLIAGLGLLISRDRYIDMLANMKSQPLLLMVMGAFTLLLGLLLLQFHNIWTMGWPVLVTLIGWITVLKGAVAMIAPQAMSHMAEKFKNKPTLLSMQAAIAILFGAFMSYMGYFA